MKKLARHIVKIITEEKGGMRFFEMLSDPLWFQAFSCLLGYDWHSSGTTTVTTAVLKDVLRNLNLGIKVAGGKGKRSLKTPEEIDSEAKNEEVANKLKYISRVVAKVDNAVLQDHHQLYHHTIFFIDDKKWCIIQQGMNTQLRTARRYHWLSTKLRSFVEEPHTGILGDTVLESVIDMTAHRSREARKLSVDLVKEGPTRIRNDLEMIKSRGLRKLTEWFEKERYLRLRIYRPVDEARVDWKALKEAYERDISNYQELVAIRGIGPATIKSLALIGELIYNVEVSRRDPIKFSFAFGGKDGIPYPVNRRRMDRVIKILEEAVEEMETGRREKIKLLSNLSKIETGLRYGEGVFFIG